MRLLDKLLGGVLHPRSSAVAVLHRAGTVWGIMGKDLVHPYIQSTTVLCWFFDKICGILIHILSSVRELFSVSMLAPKVSSTNSITPPDPLFAFVFICVHG